MCQWTPRFISVRDTGAIYVLSIATMTRCPKIGDPLPRAAEAWFEPSKWSEWIFAGRGHGPQWTRVLHVDLGDVDLVWEVIARRVLTAPVSRVRDLGAYGLNCEVNVRVGVRRR